MTLPPTRIAVLVSGRGRGTNLQAILDACHSGQIHGAVALVVSTTPDTPAMTRASQAQVPCVHLPAGPAARAPGWGAAASDVDEFDAALDRLLLDYRIDLVCLAGFMRKIGPRVLARCQGRIMNVHPSLIPAFSGQGMYGLRVHQAALDYGVKVTGCTVQLVDEEYDSGPIIIQRAVPVEENDTPESLAARVLPHEHAAYVDAIALFADGRLRVEGRKVRILKKESVEAL
jgi:phosphoribosylglycinamide formyltransferase 1